MKHIATLATPTPAERKKTPQKPILNNDNNKNTNTKQEA